MDEHSLRAVKNLVRTEDVGEYSCELIARARVGEFALGIFLIWVGTSALPPISMEPDREVLVLTVFLFKGPGPCQVPC